MGRVFLIVVLSADYVEMSVFYNYLNTESKGKYQLPVILVYSGGHLGNTALPQTINVEINDLATGRRIVIIAKCKTSQRLTNPLCVTILSLPSDEPH